MKVHYTLRTLDREVSWHSGTRDGKFVQCEIDRELTKVGAQVLVCGEFAGKDISVALDAERKIVAVLLCEKFMSFEWVDAFTRQFGKVVLDAA